ncbi:MAG: hypothetical protein WCL60_01380 [Methylococcales bacterium]
MTNIYFDFSATFNGNGTAPTQASSGGAAGAYNTFVGVTPNSGDSWWIRRSNSAMTLAAVYAGALGGVNIIGWPISGDDFYASRPAAGISAGWDSDSTSLYAKILSSSATYNFAPTGVGANFQRLWVSSTNTATQTIPLASFAGASTTCKNSKFTFDNAINGTSVQLPPLSITGATPNFQNITTQGSSTGATTTPIVTITQAAAAGGYIKNLTVNAAALPLGAGSIISSAAVQYTGVVGYQPIVFEGLTINILGSQSYHIGTALLTLTQGPCIRDLSITGPTGTAYQGSGLYLLAPRNDIYNVTCTGNAGPIVIGGSNGIVEVKNWSISYQLGTGTTSASAGTYTTAGSGAPIAFLAGASGNQFNLTNANIKAANQQIYNAGNWNQIMFNWVQFSGTNATGSNITGGTVAGTSAGFDFDLFEQNSLQVLGSFRYTNRHGQWTTTNTYRTGSAANFALKCVITEPALSQNRRELPIGVKGREQAFLNLTNGTNVIRLYGSYKSWAGTNEALPTLRDIGINFDYYNGSGYVAISSFTDGALPSDSSTWNNDSGLTGFIITTTLTDVSGAQAVPFNIFASPEFDSSGYIYIDPAVTVGTS